MSKSISQLSAAAGLTADARLEVAQLSNSVTITAATISAQASDNSFNDSGAGFAAFAVGMRVNVTGFTGNVANNIDSAVITAKTNSKLTIGGTDGDVIVDDAAGESVTITAWESERIEIQDILDMVSAGPGGSGGIQSIPILAAAMTASTTAGAASNTTETTTNDVMLPTLDFDQSTQEHAQFLFPMPKSWDELTTTAEFIWTADSGSGNVIWGIQAVAISEGDALDAAWGTAEEVTDALTTAGDNHTTSRTDAITAGGSPAEGDLVAFRIYRKAADGSDTLTADARLIGIRLFITTNAGDDS